MIIRHDPCCELYGLEYDDLFTAQWPFGIAHAGDEQAGLPSDTMTIRRAYLYMDENGPAYEARSNFGFDTFYITDYVSRDLYKKRFRYEDANKLIISIESPVDEVEYKPVFKVLDVKSTLAYAEINMLSGVARTEKLLGLIEEGGAVCEPLVPGIEKAIRDSTADFRNGGYKNVWVFKTRRGAGFANIQLGCELDRDAFTLTLTIKLKDGRLYERAILRTKPDSIIYHHRFKDILLEGNDVVIVDRFDRPLYTASFSEIESNASF